MAAKSFLAIIISLFANSLLSQDNPDKFILRKSQYWNLSYSLGGVYDINHNTSQSKKNNTLGYNYNFDISYTPNGPVGFFANYSYSNVNLINAELAKHPGDIRFLSIILGGRVYTNDKTLFADLGSGISATHYMSGLSIAAGAGGKLKIIDGYNLILRGSLHSSIFREGGEQSNIYFVLSGGLEVNNCKTIYSETVNEKSRYSVGLMMNKTSETSYTGNFSIEASYNEENRTAMVLSYLYDTQNFHANNLVEDRHLIFFDPRFYFGNGRTRLFFETGANLGLSKKFRINLNSVELSSKYYELLFGFNVGTGAEIGLLKNISAIAKANVFVFFESVDGFINYSGGLRYTF